MKKLLLLLPFLFVCCGDDEETIDPIAQQQQYNQQTIIGRWVRFAQGKEPYYTVFYDVSDGDTLIFGTDGRYTKIYQDSKTPFSGEYSVSSLYLTLSGLWTYDIYFYNTDTMRLKEYGFGNDNRVMKYKRMR